MAIIEGVFVNLGSCGSHESAEGIGGISLSGTRNFLQHEWPQMDIGEIKFHNPRTCTDEVARNRTLTRNQALWLTNRIASYINTLGIPNEDRFDHTENGRLRLEEDPEFKGRGEEHLGQYLSRSAGTPEKEGKADRAGSMREASEMFNVVHSLEASLTEAVRDNPGWARPYDHQALVRARAITNPTN